ncbi:MAG: hypothetical protein A3C80_01755 [Candidatus Ryanbacteria bacterium RIFCSPHIGHO2_02_FULL_45_43]|uniref:M23ase beta-sheet core domain-containing protein n=1 Tax=Candidatus Ryanbacteria bacterium RIFCSPHIGHO2_01_45_13 TaxID=1802112 RepID=A0A1G2FY17_9BACT|nr:MAG: hypothetical protein A2718_02590 [Candidatus Ryanbacteria bacterium RIFCSPHIGHO2_01_FULL_44_130]OGZ42966.1 MAG: hypothetical protein A2W41_02530 [Candidatus Ryanbacteria bacterium RIFCSPHIGHO2_01_45_13]OGZ48671.1 MAG: hypothetical protein A3C80_01755 [Candidatus Ryanbacteria bacterium RIFCSPHIGHO2_02_FULL_45_43]OGZ50611.1 MAG: hypothetical protein A3E55_03235 [Candidatus Ryanbacteria bacterium RIFCSPHIGHO2_12_FULL_44_20]OGZ51917.1 MAG: hypothetical protein A3A17_00610 [Candidatus Ryanba
MLKRYKFAVLFALLLFLPMSSLQSSTIDELKDKIQDREKQISDIESEIASYQKTLDETEKKASTLNNEIIIRDTRIKKINADIRLTESNIKKAELVIETLILEILDKEQKITDRKATLAELIRTIHELEGETLIEIFLANEQISDFFGDVEYLQNLDSAIQANLMNLKDLKTILENEKELNEREKSKLSTLRSDFSARKTIEENIKKDKAALLKKTQQEEAKYQQLLDEREKARAEIIAEINEIEEQLRLLIDPSQLPPKGTKVLAWPVEDPFITQGYGYTVFAVKRSDIYQGKGHNGIDFRASIGTPILAVADGVVVDTGNTDLTCLGGSYGKWIVIKHSNNLATVYAHLSLINVKKGQEVKKGESIAYSGDSGYTLGPHLHFTVYAANTLRFAPSPSGRCRYQPYGGPIDPLDYLPSI